MINRAILLYLLLSAIVLFFVNMSPADGKGLLDILTFRKKPQTTATVSLDQLTLRHSVSVSILINAAPSVVWQAIHDERQVASDLVSSKVLENDGSNCVLEQRWRILPFLKDTSCTVSETEYENKRIDFKLLSSDEFKVMQGSWLLKPISEGKTQLEVQTYLQLNRFGFSSIVEMIAKRKMVSRLRRIKEMAEEGVVGSQVHGRIL